MMSGLSVKAAIEARTSIRTYAPRPVREELALLGLGGCLSNPLGPAVRVQVVQKDTAPEGEKLGTYGFIKGAKTFLAVTVPKAPHAAEAVGYAFEKMVLQATALGLGTCWLGGTFRRSSFAAAIDIGPEEAFSILSPIGYPAEKKRLVEHVFRGAIGSRNRKPWQKLFFCKDLATPLTPEAAGEYRQPLELLRLAPSAVNRQPWRVLADDRGFHFFKKTGIGGETGGLDMQRIDVGIAICHFHLAAQELGLQGHLERIVELPAAPSSLEYVASW
ncbi:MAG: nitroreductase family protein, partial [Clostridia bacterium]|nr:nitroreductase family protein [Clostridia bacterium]